MLEEEPPPIEEKNSKEEEIPLSPPKPPVLEPLNWKVIQMILWLR